MSEHIATGGERVFHNPEAAARASEIARKYEELGRRAEFGCIEPGKYYPPHAHGEDKWLSTAAGSLLMQVADGEWFILDPGEEVFMPAGTVHEAKVGNEPWWYASGVAA